MFSGVSLLHPVYPFATKREKKKKRRKKKKRKKELEGIQNHPLR